jgi:hypothetical protein
VSFDRSDPTPDEGAQPEVAPPASTADAPPGPAPVETPAPDLAREESVAADLPTKPKDKDKDKDKPSGKKSGKGSGKGGGKKKAAKGGQAGAAAATPAAAAVTGDGNGTAGPVRPLLVGIGALAVALVVAFVLLIVKWSDASDLSSKDHQRGAAERAAQQFSVAFATLDSNDPNATIKRVDALLSKRYRAEFDKSGASGPSGPSGPTGPSGRVTLTSEVQHTYLADLEGDKATAVCEIVSTLTSGGQSIEVPGKRYFRLSLVREGSAWKVDQVETFLSAQTGSSGTSGASGATQGGPSGASGQ